MSRLIVFLLFFCCTFYVNTLSVDNYDIDMYGIADTINQTIVNITDQLKDLELETFHVQSGNQEFGFFELDFKNITIVGADKLIAEKINFRVVPIVLEMDFYAANIQLFSKDYFLTGRIDMPLFDSSFPLSGSDGYLNFGMGELRVNVSVNVATNISGAFVTDVAIGISAESMPFDAENLMGGGALGNAFNTVLDDCAITAFNYYKDALIIAMNDQFKALAQAAICTLIPQFCKT